MKRCGDFDSRREEQAVASVWTELNELIMQQVQLDNSEEITEIINAVKEKRITPKSVAGELYNKLMHK